MNIFVLDTEPELAALYHHDIHVNSGILESAQMLSCAHRILNANNKNVYELTHDNHPCNIWIRESADHYEWLYSLFFHLHEQYKLRFNKQHKGFVVINRYLKEPPDKLEPLGILRFAQVMPKQYRQSDIVQAYRDYYKQEKIIDATWSSPSSKPNWIK